MKNKINLTQVGTDMIEMARKAIKIIQNESHTLIIEEKLGYQGKEDYVTSGDKKAQEMYQREITRLYPTFGIVGEENNLSVPCTDRDHNAYFTVDPLDGTKAYIRKQSHGVSTMLALVCDGQVLAAVIGDVNTGEIYAYADHDIYGNVCRERFSQVSVLENDIKLPLSKQYVCLREAPRAQPDVVLDMIRYPNQGGLFKNVEISGGSIGCNFARMWKGEIGAMVLEPGKTTPWDEAPVIGISLRMGFRFFSIESGGTLTPYLPQLKREVGEKLESTLVIHETHVPEFKAWLEANKK